MTATFEMRARCYGKLSTHTPTRSTVDLWINPWIGSGRQHGGTEGFVTDRLKLIGGKTRLSAARSSRGTEVGSGTERDLIVDRD